MENPPENSETPDGGLSPVDFTRLENIYGYFPRVTSTPTWTPTKFQDAFALDTTGATFYYYDFANGQWRSISSSSLSSDVIDALNAANAPDSGNPFATIADLPTATPTYYGDGSDGSATLDGTNTYIWASNLAASISLSANPSNTNTLTLDINGTNVVFTFLNTLGGTAGNVKIGGSAAATTTNLLALLQTPEVNTGGGIALSPANRALVQQFTWTSPTSTSIIGKICRATLTSFSGSMTASGSVSATVSNQYAVTRDAYLTNLTINAGTTLFPANFRLYGTGTFTNAGTVDVSGGNGGNAWLNTVGGTNPIGGIAGTAHPSKTLGGGADGRDGSNGAGVGGIARSDSLGGGGGDGGSGQFSGGAGGTATAATAHPMIGHIAQLMGYINSGLTLVFFTGGGGGASGGGSSSGVSGVGGGSGAGGGLIYLAFAVFNNSGTIKANGGDGGNALGGGGGGNPAAGGGGPGGGGVIVIITRSYTNTGTIQANYGSLGSGDGGGSSGSAGTNGNVYQITA